MNSYYHTLDSGNSAPLDLLINLISVQEFLVFVGSVSSLPSGTRYRWAWDRLGTVARCTKWHPDGGLGNPAHIVWGRKRHPGRISLRMEPE